MENSSAMKALFIIANAGFGDSVVDIARSCGAQGATIINARGTANASMKKSLLGIGYDPEKEIIISLVTDDVANKIMEALPEKAGVNTPANGLCFSMPVNHTTTINKLYLQTEI
ncbi:MAG: P-II family nitrogen regulator [Christensenellaceae bacterium]|jgi:nitrogen regulatory protein PII|nr:P-II family nitrogen regulator [Christensenellaceae bacterium]